MTAKEIINEEKYEAMKKLIKADNKRWEEIHEGAIKSRDWCLQNNKNVGKNTERVIQLYEERKAEILASKTIELPYGTLRDWYPGCYADEKKAREGV